MPRLKKRTTFFRHASEGWHLGRFGATIAYGAGRLTLHHDEQAERTGVTADLVARVDQHKRGVGSDFCRKYHPIHLVLIERHDDIVSAITREDALKAWKSEPPWRDLANDIL